MQSAIAKHICLVLFLAIVMPDFAAAMDLRVRPAEWAQPVIGFELGNFYQVSDDVYRSQQPDDEALRELEKAGFRAVLNLREYHVDDNEEAGNLKLYRVPMDAGEITDVEMERALKAIAEAPKPILVHCWHGSDRTGVVVAMYRMVFQNWPREKAVDEFVNGGYGYHKSVYPNIEQYLETVDVRRFQRRFGVAKSTTNHSDQSMDVTQKIDARHIGDCK